ncbi:MAG: hypothetical protein LBT88_02325 [Oscillospiraceae bacterium]|jgi:hypothetical protein|nr:hypothetical protein [Oscillospiraceae bacterium]
MAFIKMAQTLNSQGATYKYGFDADNGSYVIGTALVLSAAGKLQAPAAALSTKPLYTAAQNKKVDSAADADISLTVEPVTDNSIYEVPLSVAAATLAKGQLLAVDSGGLTVSGATGGSFLVESFTGTAIGDIVRGRFVEPLPVPPEPDNG